MLPFYVLFFILTIKLLHTLVITLRSPLRHLPRAHPLAPYTSLPITLARYQGRELATLRRAHAHHGPIVCVGPNEVSVNCVEGGVRSVYSGGFEKADASGKGGGNWYSFFENFGGVPNMFSTGGNKAHSARKRILSNIYSKSVIQSSPSLSAQVSRILHGRFLPRLASTFQGQDPGTLNIYALLSGATMDIVTGYIFGLQASSNLVDNPTRLAWFLDLYNSRRSFNFWPQEFPGLTAWLKKWAGYRLSPKWVDDANYEIERWTEGMCAEARRVMLQNQAEPQDIPVVYQQLSAGLIKEAEKSGGNPAHLDRVIASELLDHLAAGFDTSGITLTYIIHELSRHGKIQADLQRELRTLAPQLVAAASPKLPDPKMVDALPLLHAVVWESLRLHSAIPGPQPRFTPLQGCQLGPEGQNYFVPGGVRISASAGLLHLNEKVYEQASVWIPQRWLETEKLGTERRRDMESRWFWAFGSGGRMCVGSHLAVYQMKFIVATLYSNYSTEIVNDEGIEQIDAYTAPPRHDKLMIRLRPLATSCVDKGASSSKVNSTTQA